MASLSVKQIVGENLPKYEAYYKQADPNNTGSVGAMDAAKFMKKSGLNDNVLAQIWELSDRTGKGYLEKPGFFTALKLIAMVQNGQDPSLAKLTLETPAPNLGPVEIITEVETSSGGQWAINANEKTMYDKVFDSLHPVNNLLAGDKVKPVLLNSKLPVDVLGFIWELSDIDKDGYLDRDEFAVAMHLVHKGISKEVIPTVLPPYLIPPSKRKGHHIAGGVQVLPSLPPQAAAVIVSGTNMPVLQVKDAWVVTPAEKLNYDKMFKNADLDLDGFVSGQEIKDIFLQSGLQNNILAHIWSLCDTNETGKLTSEQFALAMYLIQQKRKGIDPPARLTPEMIPPSIRKQLPADTAAFGVLDGGTSAGPFGYGTNISAMKELDAIQKEIDDIKREKMKVEAEQQQQLADLRICQVEVQTLENELSSITITLHQLENQKVDAQKILDELDEKKSDHETRVAELRKRCEDEQSQIDSLMNQLETQKKSSLNLDEEMNKMRLELNALRDEENLLEQKVESGKQQLEQLEKSYRDIVMQVNRDSEGQCLQKKHIQWKVHMTKSKVQQLQSQHKVVLQELSDGTAPADFNDFGFTVTTLDHQSNTKFTPSSETNKKGSFTIGPSMNDDTFKKKDPFGGDSQLDLFSSEDPFKSGDPFSSDPFSSEDPFKDAFPATTLSSNTAGDLFGSDPFAPAFPERATSNSPTPVLPPKQKKAPPPRPAPPLAKSPVTLKASPLPTVGGFANDPFGEFDPFSTSSNQNKKTGAFSDDELNWGSSVSPSTWGSKSKSATSSPAAGKTRATLSKKEQEEADYQFALKLSRGEVNDKQSKVADSSMC